MVPFTRSYLLTYKVDGEIYHQENVLYGTPLTTLDSPIKEGHTFSGWSKTPTTMPAHDIEINGSFQVNLYKVLYYIENDLVHKDEVAFGDKFDLWIYIPESDGVTFNGWIGETFATMPAHDISYKADITNGIVSILNNTNPIQKIYTLDGNKQNNIQKGVNIVRKKDGSFRKIIKNVY